MKITSIAGLVAAAAALPAAATDVTVIGMFPGMAVITIDRGAPKTLKVGERTSEGVLLISVANDKAVLEIDGKRETLEMGQHFETAAMTGSRTSVTLTRDGYGHFRTDGYVNGVHVRFLVDTGATLVALPMSAAQRMGINYLAGTPAMSRLADGRVVPSYRVNLESVTVGDLTLYNVEGSVNSGTGEPLLGMSFLSRTELRNEGQTLVLTKRY